MRDSPKNKVVLHIADDPSWFWSDAGSPDGPHVFGAIVIREDLFLHAHITSFYVTDPEVVIESNDSCVLAIKARR